MANRQSIRSRKMMQEALLTLLQEKAYAKISITEINQRANLSRRTFYDHFETKDDLFISLVDDILEPIFTVLMEIVNVSMYGKESEVAFIMLFQQWQDNHKTLKLIRNARSDAVILSRLFNWFHRLYDEVVLPQIKDKDTSLGEYTVCMIAGASFTLLTRWSDEGMKHPPDLMGKYLFTLLGPPSLVGPRSEFTELFEKIGSGQAG